MEGTLGRVTQGMEGPRCSTCSQAGGVCRGFWTWVPVRVCSIRVGKGPWQGGWRARVDALGQTWVPGEQVQHWVWVGAVAEWVQAGGRCMSLSCRASHQSIRPALIRLWLLQPILLFLGPDFQKH